MMFPVLALHDLITKYPKPLAHSEHGLPHPDSRTPVDGRAAPPVCRSAFGWDGLR